jgi:hypothetical protein
VLPGPAGDSAVVQFTVNGGSDSLRIQTGALHLAGAATTTIEGNRVVVRASLMPTQPPRGRRPVPLEFEYQAVLRGGALSGLATIRQRFAGSYGTFDAIGKLEVRRTN